MMKYESFLNTAIIAFIAVFTIGCIKNKTCSHSFYFGISAANEDDELRILEKDSLIYQGKFESYFRWDNNDMRKLIDRYCSNDSLLDVSIKLLNTNQDTSFHVNTNVVKGMYISTATAAKGEYIITYDYYDGGLKDVIWTDNIHP